MLNEIDLTDTDLNLFVLFEAVFRARHVGQAARALHVSPSAVSHGLRRLREVFEDPLFLKTPKGVVPSARALELAPAIAEVLSRVRGVVGSVAPFDPAKSTRRFVIGTADATAAVMIPGLLANVRKLAPHIDLGFVQLLPQNGLPQLEARAVDMVVLALDPAAIAPRFHARVLFEDEFVVAARSDHPFFTTPTLRQFCASQHMLVSTVGDTRGNVDIELEARGLKRRVAVAVPSFMLALLALGDSDLLAAVPKHFIERQATRFGLASTKLPLPVPKFEMRAVVLAAAVRDTGIAWLLEQIPAAFGVKRGSKRRTL